MSGNQVKAQASGSTYYIVLGIALILAVLNLSRVPPSRAASYTGATSAASNVTTAAAASDWTTYMQGNDRTGFTSDSGFNPTSVRHLHVAWRRSDTGKPDPGVFSQPVVSNGLVYWGSFDGRERATTTSGNLVWRRNLGTTAPPNCTPVGPNSTEAGVASTGTVTTDVPVDGATSVLYVAGGNSKMYALNAATGAILWSYDVGGNPNTFLWDSPLVSGNSVYIGVASFGDCPLVQGKLLQLNRVTGALQNTYKVVPNGCDGGGIWGSPTLDAAAGTIYFDTGSPSDNCPNTPGEPSVVEVRASDLSLVGSWTLPAAQQIDDADFGATPTLFNGVIGGKSEPLVGVANKNGVFYAFERDALPAGPVWSTRVAVAGSAPTLGTGDIASAAFDGTTLYVGGDTKGNCAGTVNALNPSTGAFIWRHCFTAGPVLGAATATSGGVVAVGEGNKIAVVSAATGVSRFTYTGTGLFWGPPSIVGNMLYEGDMAGHLYALTTN
jgi:polyvinyl alcohol dehydrogenase (cytochrome)